MWSEFIFSGALPSDRILPIPIALESPDDGEAITNSLPLFSSLFFFFVSVTTLAGRTDLSEAAYS